MGCPGRGWGSPCVEVFGKVEMWYVGRWSVVLVGVGWRWAWGVSEVFSNPRGSVSGNGGGGLGLGLGLALGVSEVFNLCGSVILFRIVV